MFKTQRIHLRAHRLASTLQSVIVHQLLLRTDCLKFVIS